MLEANGSHSYVHGFRGAAESLLERSEKVGGVADKEPRHPILGFHLARTFDCLERA